MTEGTIKRLTDRGFGFIDTGSDKDLFFHSSSLDGVSYDELQEGQRVSYTEGSGPKGPCAENVKWGASGFVDTLSSYFWAVCWVSNSVGVRYSSDEWRRSML